MKFLISFVGSIIRKIFGESSVQKIYLFKFKISIFFTTLSLRRQKFNYFFWPVRHLGMLFMLKRLNNFFQGINIDFFLMDGALLGAIRQGSIAGRASDLDIGVVSRNEEEEKYLMNFLIDKKFRIRKTSKTSFHIFHEKINIFADLSFFRHSDDGVNFYFHWGNEKKKLLVKKSEILPLKFGQLYYENCYIPNKSEKMLEMIYGKNFLTPINKKNQFYLK